MSRTPNPIEKGRCPRMRMTVAALAFVTGIWAASISASSVEAQVNVSTLENRKEVSQHGVTWTFDREVPVGQFVNGDCYVVGSVTVVDIDPAPVDGRNGSILNLDPRRGKSGFDARQNKGNSYDSRMRSAPPISMKPGDSLLSSVSSEKQRQYVQMLWPFDPAKGMTRCWVRSVSVLTCVAEPQSADAFRPAFCDRENRVYLARDLRRDLLPNLEPVEGTPSPLEFAKHYDRCWVDVMRQNKSAPAEYAAQYGRETSRAGGMATLILMCDFPEEEKERLLVNFVQYGIDLYGTLEAGWGGWETLGGHGQGRKWPIVFAGIMLGSEAMARPDKTFQHIIFQEDDQTVYGEGWTGATALFAGHIGKRGWELYPDQDSRGFFAEPIHPSEWPNDGKGTKFSQPGRTAEAYRRCCTSHAWIATALSIRIMHAEDVWNHDPFCDYCDRWMTEDDTEHVKILKEHAGLVIDSAKRQRQTWDPWVDAAYKQYRNDLPQAEEITYLSPDPYPARPVAQPEMRAVRDERRSSRPDGRPFSEDRRRRHRGNE